MLQIATLFTAQNVRDYLSSEEGLDGAMDWCKKTGVTHVFIETFRSNYSLCEEGKLARHRLIASARFRHACIINPAGICWCGLVLIVTRGHNSLQDRIVVFN